MTSWCAAVVLLLVSGVVAASPGAQLSRGAVQVRPFSVAAGAVVSPLERYPLLGLQLEAGYELSSRWRFSAQLGLYAPRGYGDVTRYLFTLDLRAHLTVLRFWRFAWTLHAGLGLGLFHDSFASRSVFDDETLLAPGLLLGSGLAFELDSRWTIYLELHGAAYHADPIADDEWLQACIGARWRI
jgi:hypothetical protein